MVSEKLVRNVVVSVSSYGVANARNYVRLFGNVGWAILRQFRP